jgi:pyrroloquinoline-quinone synthase
MSAFDASVERWNLHNHPFYQAWAAGTLPVDSLAQYAAEWGAFVRVVDRGWESCGQAAYAAEERAHAVLWDEFAQALGVQATDTPATPQLAALRATAERLFSTEATALGALYAFEAQQPGTSQSKLAGLKAHYSLDPAAEQYFAVHENDYAEAEWLREAIARLSPAGREVAEQACAAMCEALWEGLSGIPAECAMA